MRHGRNALGGLAIAVFVLLLAGCGTEATPTTSRATSVPEPSTSEPSDTTTTVTSVEVGSQALPAGGFLEPGEYVTTVFEPTVMYTIETRRIGPFQDPRSTGIQNRRPRNDLQGLSPYRGVAIHNIWLRAGTEEIVEELEEKRQLTLGDPVAVEIAGFPGIQIDAVVEANAGLWTTTDSTLGSDSQEWHLEANQIMRFVILETPAGSLLITVGAHTEEWEEFLPVAEDILAGISFPDLG